MIIAITNHKGGTGKTTTVANLGVALANKGKRVLLIDLDPQSNLSYSFGKSDSEFNISHIFTGEKSFEEVVISVEKVDLLAASMMLADIELSLQSVENREYILKEIIDPIKGNYDYILIDCPPSRSLLTINALSFADSALIPMLLDVLSIQGVLHILETIDEVKEYLNSKLKIIGVLAVNVDIRKKLSREVIGFFRSNFDYSLMKTMIRSNVKIAEAPSHGLSVVNYAPNSYGAVDYISLAKEIIQLN